MLFGLANAPATFQAYVNRALSRYLDAFCIVYLDDILIFSSNPSEHREHVRSVLVELGAHGLYVKLDKCAFSTKQVDFVGFIVSNQGIEIDPEKTKTISEWPTLKSVRDI